jgi:hypothetical protein
MRELDPAKDHRDGWRGRGSATDYLELAKNFGADGALPKPFSTKDFVQEIERVMVED